MDLLTKQKQKQMLQFNFKEALKYYFKNHFFIVYSMLNFFIPFFMCLIGACVKNYGTLIVVVIGLTTSFFTVFNQLAILTSIAISIQRIQMVHGDVTSKLNIDSQERTHILSTSLLVATVYGCIMMILFVVSCGLYTSFSATYKNLNATHDGAINMAWEFIGITWPTIFINYISNVLLIEIFIVSGSMKATFYYVGIMIIEILLAVIFSLNTNLNILGIGLAMLLASVMGFLLYGCDIFIDHRFWNFKPRINKQDLSGIFKNTVKFSSRYIFGTILKAFLVLGIGLSLQIYNRETFGAMLLARIVWYNIMYTCGCYGDAIILQANFMKAKYHKNLGETLNIINVQKMQITLVAIIEFIIVLSSCLLIPSIANVYLQNPESCGSTFTSIEGNGWVINSWLNIPYNNNGFDPTLGTTHIQPNGYVPGGSTSMIYLSIFIWTMALTKIMCFSPFYSAKEKKSNVVMAYLTPFIITAFVAIMGLSTMNYQGIVGNFFFGFQGFSFALMIVGILLFSMGILAVIKSHKFVGSERFLEMHNQYVVALNNIVQPIK